VETDSTAMSSRGIQARLSTPLIDIAFTGFLPPRVRDVVRERVRLWIFSAVDQDASGGSFAERAGLSRSSRRCRTEPLLG
jgi:hypothetical protein